jgi:hypothetical protein
MNTFQRGALAVLFAGGMAGASCTGSTNNGGTYCISGRAWIATPAGRRRLADLEVGDEVFSVDPETGQRVAGPITAIQTAERECVELEAGTDATLVCTSDHPVWDPETGVYVDAGDWVTGSRDSLLIVEGAGVEARRLTGSEEYVGVHRVYDITVNTDHHNFVANGVVVHNKTPPPPECQVDGELKYQGQECTCPDGSTGEVDCFERFTDAGTPADMCRCPDSDAGMEDGGGG